MHTRQIPKSKAHMNVMKKQRENEEKSNIKNALQNRQSFSEKDIN